MDALHRMVGSPHLLSGQNRDTASTALEEAVQQLLSPITSKKDIRLHVENYLNESENYALVPEGEREEFKRIIANDNNYSQLAKCIQREVDIACGSHAPTRDESKQAICAQQQNFLINLEEAYLRGRSSNQVNSILWKEGLRYPQLEQIEVIEGSDPHFGGKQACFLRYSCLKFDFMASDGPIYSDEDGIVVYKPRSVVIEAALADDQKSLFAAINASTGKRSLAVYRIECARDDRGEFGLIEYIPREFVLVQDEEMLKKQQEEKGLNKDEKDEQNDEIFQFYKTVGALQFAAQLFGITDLHRQNVIVSRNKMPNQPCMMYPIDLETSFDVRVVTRGYTTGLLRDLKQASEGDSNFIVTKTSPRGRRELMSHPEDIEAIKRGFKELQDDLNNTEVKKALLDLADELKLQGLCHRFVPIPQPRY